MSEPENNRFGVFRFKKKVKNNRFGCKMGKITTEKPGRNRLVSVAIVIRIHFLNRFHFSVLKVGFRGIQK